MNRSGTGLFLAISLSTGCWGPAEAPAPPGRLEARWTGPDTGQLSAPATAEWCPDRPLLEVRAVLGDTGFAMVLYPVDTIEPDTYRVVPPSGADSVAPSAAVALRLFSANAIEGYQGDSGTVVVERSGVGDLTGTVEATSRSVLGGEVLRITGKFRDLLVVPQGRGCSPETVADSAGLDPELSDTGVN